MGVSLTSMLQEIVSPAAGIMPVIVGLPPFVMHGASVDTSALACGIFVVSVTSNVGPKVTVCPPAAFGINSVGITSPKLTAKDKSSTLGQLSGWTTPQLTDTENKTVPELGEGSCGGDDDTEE
jgi:hypothetical protein